MVWVFWSYRELLCGLPGSPSACFKGWLWFQWWEARHVSVTHSRNSDKYFIFDILGHLLQTSQSKWLLPSGQSAICSICRLGRRAFSPKGNYSDEGKGQATHSGMYMRSVRSQTPDRLQSSFCWSYLFAGNTGWLISLKLHLLLH